MSATNAFGTSAKGLAAEAVYHRRQAVGEPVVRDRSRQSNRMGWTFVCPWPEDRCGFGSMYDGFETADHCRAGWIAHAESKHPGRPISWPADTPGAESGPFTGVQPVDPPEYDTGVTALRNTGALVDLAGRPLTLSPCGHGRCVTWGETCPRSLPCPTHRADPGDPCIRPSGHEVPGGYCQTRAAAAEQVDITRELAGDPTLPAPWPGREAAMRVATPPAEPVQMALDFDSPAAAVQTQRRRRGPTPPIPDALIAAHRALGGVV